MLDRTNKLLLGTAAVLIALTAIRVAQQSRPPAALWAIPGVDEAAVTAVEITGPGATLAIERRGDGWTITAPAELPAERSKVEGLLRDWKDGFTPDLKLTEEADSADDEARYGLDEATRHVLTVRAGDDALVALEVGASISGGSNYVRRVGESAIDRGRVPGHWRLKPELDEWRDRRLFPFDAEDLASLRLVNRQGELDVVRAAGADGPSWRARIPEGLALSTRKLDTLVSALASLKASKILEGSEAAAARAAAGLDSPRAVVSAGTGDGAATTLRFGADEEAGRTVFAAVDGDDRLFVLPQAKLTQFDVGADALRDMSVVDLHRAAVARLIWRSGDVRATVEPEGDTDWKVVDPPGLETAPRQLALAISGALSLQATAILPADTDLRAADGPVTTLTVERTGGAEPLVLSIGGAAEDDGGILARVEGRDAVYVVRAAVVDRLRTTFGG